MATRKSTSSGQKGRRGASAKGGTTESQLEADARALEDAVGSGDEALLQQLEGADLGETGDAGSMGRAAAPLLQQVERKKDDPSAMAERLTQRHLELGKRFLEDDRSSTLDQRLRARVGQFIGKDPGNIRVHTGERAAQAADALGARAFALGDSDIYFGKGQFAPDTAEGLGVLVHELTHVVDNSVGAAFDIGSSQAQYSRAEGRAESTQAQAEQAAQSGQDPSQAQPEAPKIDVNLLAEAVYRLTERSSRFMSDRSGAG